MCDLGSINRYPSTWANSSKLQDPPVTISMCCCVAQELHTSLEPVNPCPAEHEGMLQLSESCLGEQLWAIHRRFCFLQLFVYGSQFSPPWQSENSCGEREMQQDWHLLGIPEKNNSGNEGAFSAVSTTEAKRSQQQKGFLESEEKSH